MPARGSEYSQGRRMFSVFWVKPQQSTRQSGGQSIVQGKNSKWVTVLNGAWQADTTLYQLAPEFGTCYYADVAHDMLTDTAVALGWIDSDTGRRWLANWIDQVPTPSYETMRLRVWLQKKPTGTSKVLITW